MKLVVELEFLQTLQNTKKTHYSTAYRTFFKKFLLEERISCKANQPLVWQSLTSRPTCGIFYSQTCKVVPTRFFYFWTEVIPQCNR